MKAVAAAAILIAVCAIWVIPQQQLTPITINYPTRTGQVWPLYIAKEGGYYAKYGYDVKLAFGVHPAGIAMIVSDQAVMTPYTLEQAMQASSKDASLVMLGSPFKKSLFALVHPRASVRCAGRSAKCRHSTFERLSITASSNAS